MNWVLLLVGGKCEPWVIVPDVMSPSGYVVVVVLDTSMCGVYISPVGVVPNLDR